VFPNLAKILRALNDLHARGLVKQYALGGAAAAMWFSEPMYTEDLDVFCHLEGSGPLLSLEPIYARLRAQGHQPVTGTAHQDSVSIEGVPVQFLVGGPLVDEAIDRAIAVTIAGEPTRVFDLEYLLAIALDVGRVKDRLRIEQLLEVSTRPVDQGRLAEILGRHMPSKPHLGERSLVSRWERLEAERTEGGKP
jgi:hypothetical protein